MTPLQMRERFHDLVVKHALDEATPAELSKLDRYQALLRYKPSPEERRAEVLFRWETEQALKQLKRLCRGRQT